MPDAAGVARFAGDCAALGLAGDARLALAVSGGPDSMAMLALAHAAFPRRVIAATVDHRLRAASADEARMVADACAGLGVGHAVLTPGGPISGASIQAQARAARYALLAAWATAQGAAALLTAHHADDQAETFLMRAVRGSGPAGLSGIRARWSFAGDDTTITVARPLLAWRRATLLEIVEQSGLPFVHDPGNADPRHDRTAFRALLAASPLLDVEGLAAAARHSAESDAALDTMTEWLLWQRAAGSDAIDIAGLPRELCRRLARAMISRVRGGGNGEGAWHDGTNIEPLLDALADGRAATQGGVLVRAKGSVWHFTVAPPRRSH